jgi:hypothetical protein
MRGVYFGMIPFSKDAREEPIQSLQSEQSLGGVVEGGFISIL